MQVLPGTPNSSKVAAQAHASRPTSPSRSSFNAVAGSLHGSTMNEIDVFIQIPEDSDPALDRVFDFMEEADAEGWDNTEILMAMQTAINLVNAEYQQQTQN